MRGRDVALVVAIATACASLVFAPAILGGKLLAIGDGLIESVPAFYAPLHLWNPDFLIGYPLYADPSQAAFYPLRLLNVLPGGFNIYVITSYVVASAALFGYLADVLEDRLAAIAGAASFAFGGFMMSHFGHTVIDHPAAWTIVALWTLSRYAKTQRSAWLAGTGASVALALSSGQPQIVLFAVVLLTLYALFTQVPSAIGRRSIVGLFASVFAIALGIGLGAVSLFPAVQLGEESTRATLPFPVFSAGNIPLEHLAARLAFPYVIGGGASSFYSGGMLAAPDGAFTETTVFVSFAALVLAIAGIFGRPRPLALFWTAIAIGGIALGAGSELPFAVWTYTIPPFNAFRLPGRHAYEITLSLSILAAFGLASLRDGKRWPFVAGIACAIGAYALAVRDISMARPSLLLDPVVVWFVIAASVQLMMLLPSLVTRSVIARRLACASVVAGAVTFASMGSWRDAPPATVLQTPSYVEALRRLPFANGQRVYTYSTDAESPLRPNLPMLWGISEASGYTQLQYPQVRRFLHVADNGQFLDVNSESTDLAAIRYVAVPAEASPTLTDAAPLDASDLGMFLSGSSGVGASSLQLGFPTAVVADRLVVVSALGDSVDVRQNAVIGSITVSFVDGRRQTLLLRAGVDTAELAYNRADIVGRVLHREPLVFSEDASTTWFESSRPLRMRAPIRSVEVRIDPATHALNLRKISLIDSVAHRAYPFTEESVLFANEGHFRHIQDIDGAAIFENLRARPRVWLEVSRQGARPPVAPDASVELTQSRPERREMVAECPEACAVVSSDVDNADWHATVDGAPVAIVADRGVLQSLLLDAGRHVVVFSYFPRALAIGAGISAISATMVALWLAWPWFFRKYSRRARAGASASASIFGTARER